MTKGSRKSGGRRLRRLREVEAFERTSRQRPERRTILIQVEGRKTEPNYFSGLKSEPTVSANFTVTVKKGRGFSPEVVVEEAVKRKKQAEVGGKGKEYDEAWCVLDVEGPGRRDSLERAWALAQENDIKLCLSNPCFEVWLLSHFVRWARAYNDCDAVVVDLTKHWRVHCGSDYRKNDERIYRRVCDLTSTAISNAQWVRQNRHAGKSIVDANSSTEVYRLVRHLLG